MIALVCMLVGALLGAFLQKHLPENYLCLHSRDVIKLGTGLIATQAALVLGLLVSSSKSAFDGVNTALMDGAASRVLLDRNLDHYGPETDAVRAQLRLALMARIERLWPKNTALKSGMNEEEQATDMEDVGDLLRALTPKDEPQRLLKERALALYGEGNMQRWKLSIKTHTEVPAVFLVVLVCWFTLLFAAFGVLAPRNRTVYLVIFLCALSVAGGILLSVELGRPFEGIVRISREPMDAALRQIGR